MESVAINIARLLRKGLSLTVLFRQYALLFSSLRKL